MIIYSLVDHYGGGAGCNPVALWAKIVRFSPGEFLLFYNIFFQSKWSSGMTQDCKSWDMSSILILDYQYLLERIKMSMTLSRRNVYNRSWYKKEYKYNMKQRRKEYNQKSRHARICEDSCSRGFDKMLRCLEWDIVSWNWYSSLIGRMPGEKKLGGADSNSACITESLWQSTWLKGVLGRGYNCYFMVIADSNIKFPYYGEEAI